MTNPVVRWEINARDPEALQQFYADLFGWAVRVVDPASGYAMIDTGPGGIPGGIGPEPHYGTRIYVEVDDIPAVLERAKTLQATHVDGPVELGGFTLGVVDDAEGNRIGLVQRP
jgi:predicted enzyme related to lactoylglutathione lyase